jgi:hypothetical protein
MPTALNFQLRSHTSCFAARLEPMIIRIDERLNTTFPHLATKADLAEKPSRAYLWGVMAAMVGAQAVALGAAALIFTMIQARPAHSEPFKPTFPRFPMF